MTQERLDSEAIHARLLHDIQRGNLPESGYLREVDLAERFGVSRTPVREVLSQLLHERLLERTPKGLRVRSITPGEIIQIYDARIMLESEAAAQAARKRDVTDLVALQALLDRDRKLNDPDGETRIATNLEFHRQILDAAHNAVLDDLISRLWVNIIHKPFSTLSVGSRWEESLDEHQELINAINDSDEARASELMTVHLRTARKLRLGMFSNTIG